MAKVEDKFSLSTVEVEACEAWMKEHEKTCTYTGREAIPSHYAFTFIPSSIGVGVRVSCIHNKAEQDITDYKSW